jgi:hypothetical protein
MTELIIFGRLIIYRDEKLSVFGGSRRGRDDGGGTSGGKFDVLGDNENVGKDVFGGE